MLWQFWEAPMRWRLGHVVNDARWVTCVFEMSAQMDGQMEAARTWERPSCLTGQVGSRLGTDTRRWRGRERSRKKQQSGQTRETSDAIVPVWLDVCSVQSPHRSTGGQTESAQREQPARWEFSYGGRRRPLEEATRRLRIDFREVGNPRRTGCRRRETREGGGGRRRC